MAYRTKEPSRQARHRPRASALPAALRPIQELLETSGGPAGKEQLADARVLADWLVSQGLIPLGLVLSTSDLRRVVAFRDGLRAMVAAGAAVDAATLERVNRAAAGARVQVRLGRGGVPRIDAAATDLDDAFGRWLGILHDAHLEGQLARLKICPAPACATVFYDDSRANVRRWCTKRCGDALRARAYRQSPRYVSRHGGGG